MVIKKFSRIIISVVISSNCYAKNFFDQRYRGWLWFEEKEKQEQTKEEMLKLQKQQELVEERAKARAEIEEFAKELESLKYMMIRYPENLEHVLVYKKKEAEMFEMALKLDQSYRMVNFINPEHVNLKEQSTNLYGIKIKREMDEQQQQAAIKQLAKEVELFLIFSRYCPYSQQLQPVLSNFAKKYNFKVEAVSLDKTNSPYFETHHNAKLVEALGVKVLPTIIIVTNDSSMRFELARGAMSISELEERAILAIDYIKYQQQQAELSVVHKQ